MNSGIFSKILFPTDFSEHAKRTLDCIAGLPGISEVVLIHVVEAKRIVRAAWGSEAMTSSANRNLYEECEYLKNQGITVQSILRKIRSGSVGAAIVGEALELKPSIILIGARGESIATGVLMGSVSSHVLRYSPVHVLIMKYRVVEALSGPAFEKYCPRVLSRVLCPTDFSPHSSVALNDIARIPGIGEIRILHVVISEEDSSELQEKLNAAEHELSKIVASLARSGISCNSSVRVGDPASEISRMADEEDVSLIGLSSYGRGWRGGALLGAVVSEVAKNAARPVLVLRTRLPAEPGIMESR
ncbi:nucleotide-binding universal stress UspA family protein [Methanolinea mesophila]|uniref:universal stress protein n=1 Tax=Methanolinea mesophila TaxID=547055 RepID=UPI001AE63F93|nr:nucleotide-binding universal stress UspA family protein [Methanolinea mesophila]